MASRTLPGLGLDGFWDLGDTYKSGMDNNLRRLSVLVQAGAISQTTALPGSPTAGDIYIVPSDAGSNANEIAIYDGPSGSEAWVYITPEEGWKVYVQDSAFDMRFDGTAWQEVAEGGGGTSGEEFTSAEKTKLANMEAGATADQTGAEIVAAIDAQLGSTDWKTGGGGGGGTDYASDGADRISYGFDRTRIADEYYIKGVDDTIAVREPGSELLNFVVSKSPMPATGMYYFEVKFTGEADNPTSTRMGFVSGAHRDDYNSTTPDTGILHNGIVVNHGGAVFSSIADNTNTASGVELGQGHTVGIVFDADNNDVYFAADAAPDPTGTKNGDNVAFDGGAYFALTLTRWDIAAEIVTKAEDLQYAVPAGASVLPAGGNGGLILDDLADVNSGAATEGQVLTAKGDGTFAFVNRNPEPVAANWDTNYEPTKITIVDNVATFSGSASSGAFAVSDTPLPETGKHYWEIEFTGDVFNSTVSIYDGWHRPMFNNTGTSAAKQQRNGIAVRNDGDWYLDGDFSGPGTGPSWSSGDTVAVVFDADTREIWVGVNSAPDTSVAADFTLPRDAFARFWPAADMWSDTCVATLKSIEADFEYAVPAGATPLGGASSGGGASSFTDLGDTPADYSAAGGKFLAVNDAGSAVEFVDAPSGGAGGALDGLTDVNLDHENVLEEHIGRALGITQVTPDVRVGLLPALKSMPIPGGVEILATADFAATPTGKVTVANTHLYDEVHFYWFGVDESGSGGGIHAGIYPDGVNPGSLRHTRSRFFKSGTDALDGSVTDTNGSDKLFISTTSQVVTNNSGYAKWTNTKAGLPLFVRKLAGQESPAYLHDETNVFETVAEVRGLSFDTLQGTFNSGYFFAVGIRHAAQPVAAAFDYTGSPSGAGTLARFVLPFAATIRAGAQGEFKVESNPGAEAVLQVRRNGTQIGTVTVGTSGDPAVNISAETEMDAGDVISIYAAGSSDLTDLYGSLILEGRG